MNYVSLKENHYFLQRTCFAKRGRGATLIKAIFYPQVGSVALFFVLIPKLLFANCTVATTHKSREKNKQFFGNVVQSSVSQERQTAKKFQELSRSDSFRKIYSFSVIVFHPSLLKHLLLNLMLCLYVSVVQFACDVKHITSTQFS